jgi:hypothetical protein
MLIVLMMEALATTTVVPLKLAATIVPMEALTKNQSRKWSLIILLLGVAAFDIKK